MCLTLSRCFFHLFLRDISTENLFAWNSLQKNAVGPRIATTTMAIMHIDNWLMHKQKSPNDLRSARGRSHADRQTTSAVICADNAFNLHRVTLVCFTYICPWNLLALSQKNAAREISHIIYLSNHRGLSCIRCELHAVRQGAVTALSNKCQASWRWHEVCIDAYLHGRM